MRGKPDRFTKRAKARVIASGCQPRPSGIVNTRPVSTQAGRRATVPRSGARCIFSTQTVVASMSMTRRDRVDVTSPSDGSWSTVVAQRLAERRVHLADRVLRERASSVGTAHRRELRVEPIEIDRRDLLHLEAIRKVVEAGIEQVVSRVAIDLLVGSAGRPDTNDRNRRRVRTE
jgi:hypothetical protein